MALRGALGLAWAPVTPRRFAWQAWHKLTSYCRFAWQAWHKLTSTVVLRGRRGTHGTGWRAWTGLGACDAAALCVAGVAQTHTHLSVSRGRRGTNSHLPSFHVAGVALMALGGALGLAWAPVTPRHFAWQAWHNLTFSPSFHVAGVAQTHIHCRFAWQAWHSWYWVARLDWLGHTVTLSYTIFHTSGIVTHHLSSHHRFTHHFVTYHL